MAKNDFLSELIPGIGPYNPKEKAKVQRDTAFYMIDRFSRMFKYGGLPETITPRVFRLWLLTRGSLFFTNKYKNEYHVFYGAAGGEPDIELQPTRFIIANPYYTADLDIKKDGVLIRSDSTARGILPLINKYSSALTENELSLFIADVMARASLVMTAEDETTQEQCKNYIKQLFDGDLDVITAEKLFGTDIESVKVSPGVQQAQNVILPLIEYEQYLKGSMYNDLGLNANWNAKREAIGSNESALNEDYLNTLIYDMLKTQREAFEEINKMYGLEMTIELDGAWENNAREEEALLENIENGKEEEKPEDVEDEREKEVQEDENNKDTE